MAFKSVLEEDFHIISQSNLNFEKLKNATVLVTGATGFIGSLLVKSLLYCSSKKSLNTKVIALVRNKEKAKTVFADFSVAPNLDFLVCDLGVDEINYDGKINYIVHGASVTASKTMIERPTEVIRTSLNGTEKVLNFAVSKKVASVVYLSSMEVYGSLPNEKADENKLGFIDLSSARSCYPESKRMCECMCTAYSSQYGISIKTARLAQTFGAGILLGENRVFAQFANSVINKTDIVLHTKGESEGNYVYSRDAVIAILMLLLADGSGAYNVSNEECHMNIAQMANLVCKEVADGNIKVVYDIPEGVDFGYAPTTKLFLDSSKMRSLGWEPQVGLKEAYKRLIEYLYLIKS